MPSVVAGAWLQRQTALPRVLTAAQAATAAAPRSTWKPVRKRLTLSATHSQLDVEPKQKGAVYSRNSLSCKAYSNGQRQAAEQD